MRIAEALQVPPSFFFPAPETTFDANVEFLTSARAMLLARAFAQIRCEKTRAAIVNLVEQIAKTQPATQGTKASGDAIDQPDNSFLVPDEIKDVSTH